MIAGYPRLTNLREIKMKTGSHQELINMDIAHFNVLLAHPGKQHSYQVALALQNSGLLEQFITGIYYKPHQFPYSLTKHIPVKIRLDILRELSKRRMDTLDDSLITSIPYFEACSRILGRSLQALRMTEGRSLYLFINWAGDQYVRWWLSSCYPKPSIFYGFLGSALSSIRYAKKIGMKTILDVPIVLNADRIISIERHRLGLPTKFPELNPRLLKEVLETDYIIAPSDAVAESIKVLGVLPERILLVPFGVDVKQFSPEKKISSKDDNKFRALFVGKFDLRKGVHILLEAWAKLALPDSELVIVGPSIGSGFTNAMRTRYVNKFIEIGNQSHDDLPELYSKSDIFVFPSLAEGSALVTYEALASGLPCIVTAETGSIVQDGVEGFIVPAGDVDTLARCIRRLYEEPELREAMASAARLRAEQYSWENYAERLVASVSICASDQKR